MAARDSGQSRKEQRYTEFSRTPRQGGTIEDKHSNSSTRSELQRDVSRQKTSKPDQGAPSVKNLIEGMDNGKLKELVSIHVEEGKWQVVVLILNELFERKLPPLRIVSVCEIEGWKTEKDVESDDLESRKLIWWPTEVDKDLKTLCKVLSEGDCRLKSLHLSYNFTITDEGVKYLAEALKHSDCSLTSLHLSDIKEITDEGVKYLAEALKHSDCSLISLHLSRNRNVTDEGVKYLAEALKHSDCSLSNLHLSYNWKITDEGLKYLAEALKHSDCSLTSLHLSDNFTITDEGVKYLAEALKHSDCSLTSLHLSDIGKITDEGVKCHFLLIISKDRE